MNNQRPYRTNGDALVLGYLVVRQNWEAVTVRAWQ